METQTKKQIGNDLRALLLRTDFLRYCAESHYEGWKTRYEGKRKKDVAFDLRMNHDDSIEIERAEENLKRKLTDDEIDYLGQKFHAAVVKIHNS